MHIIARRVKCICTGGHYFESQRSIFKHTNSRFTVTCRKCGAYRTLKNRIDVKNGYVEHIGPEYRMEQYWKEHAHNSSTS